MGKEAYITLTPIRIVLLLAAVQLVLLTLKMTGVIGWSWWLVLLPVYGVPLFMVLTAVVVMVVFLVGMERDKG